MRKVIDYLLVIFGWLKTTLVSANQNFKNTTFGIIKLILSIVLISQNILTPWANISFARDLNQSSASTDASNEQLMSHAEGLLVSGIPE